MYTDCYCTQLRRASGALTRLYDEAMKPAGLRVTQFSLLRSLGRLGEATTSEVADELDLDRTTISRNVKLLIDAGWVDEAGPGEDRRERLLRLNASGQKKIKEALPYFLEAQRIVEQKAGPLTARQDTTALMQALLSLQQLDA